METTKSKGKICPLKEAMCPQVGMKPCAWYNKQGETCVIHLIPDRLDRLVEVGKNIAKRIGETVSDAGKPEWGKIDD